MPGTVWPIMRAAAAAASTGAGWMVNLWQADKAGEPMAVVRGRAEVSLLSAPRALPQTLAVIQCNITTCYNILLA